MTKQTKWNEYLIQTDWRGRAIPADERVRWRLSSVSDGLLVEVEAPFYDNLVPLAPPGPTERLWEFEVAEIFFLGENDRYLEVELGPAGHYLVLRLKGRRSVEESGLPIDYRATVRRGRWNGRARIPSSYLPKGRLRFNAFAIFERDGVKNHLALFPSSGEKPDFHRLEDFGVLEGFRAL